MEKKGRRDAPHLLALCPSLGVGGGVGEGLALLLKLPISPVSHSSPDARSDGVPEKSAFSRHKGFRDRGAGHQGDKGKWRTTGASCPSPSPLPQLRPVEPPRAGERARSTSPGTWTWSRFCDPAERGPGSEGAGTHGHLGRGGCGGSLYRPFIVTPPPLGRA